MSEIVGPPAALVGQEEAHQELELLVEVLGNQTAAAHRLGISQRAISYYLGGREIPEPTAKMIRAHLTIEQARRSNNVECEWRAELLTRGTEPDIQVFAHHLLTCPFCLRAAMLKAAGVRVDRG